MTTKDDNAMKMCQQFCEKLKIYIPQIEKKTCILANNLKPKTHELVSRTRLKIIYDQI